MTPSTAETEILSLAGGVSVAMDAEMLSCSARQVAAALCCRDFSFMHLSPDHKPSIIENRPKAWIKEYTQRDWMPIDPTVSYAMQADRPFLWRECLDDLTDQQQELMGRAKYHGLVDGLVIPLVSLRQEKAFLFFWSDQDIDADMVTRLSSILTAYAAAFFQGWARLNRSRSHPVIALSPRERQTLLYAALNHSNATIGQVMQISEETVRSHIKNAAEKLGATGKQGAVVKAILYQLIHP